MVSRSTAITDRTVTRTFSAIAQLLVVSYFRRRLPFCKPSTVVASYRCCRCNKWDRYRKRKIEGFLVHSFDAAIKLEIGLISQNADASSIPELITLPQMYAGNDVMW